VFGASNVSLFWAFSCFWQRKPQVITMSYSKISTHCKEGFLNNAFEPMLPSPKPCPAEQMVPKGERASSARKQSLNRQVSARRGLRRNDLLVVFLASKCELRCPILARVQLVGFFCPCSAHSLAHCKLATAFDAVSCLHVKGIMVQHCISSESSETSLEGSRRPKKRFAFALCTLRAARQLQFAESGGMG